MKWKWTVLAIGLCSLFLLLAYKDPFKTNNLISNLEPFPDTFYYSVPVWNWIHGQGYKMAYGGMEISKDVPPLYGLYLAPFFKIFNDVRSFYFANMLLCFGSILLFIRLTVKYYEKSKIRWWIAGLTGFILVTNFYFYNLPTLMMAENLQIFLILVTVNVMLEKFNLKNIVLSVILAILMLLSKMSNLPVIACLIMWLLVKIFKTKFWKKYDKKTVIVILTVLFLMFGVFFWKYLFPNLILFTEGSWFFSFGFFKKFFPVYLSEFLGKNGHYLWYSNQQIESMAGYLALVGIIIGLIWDKFREKTLILVSVILAVVVFHSFLYFPEGRYISVVIPLYIVFIGIIPELLSKVKFGIFSVVVIALLFLGIRQNINGFNERKFTSLKRQILNNRLEENEVPWNYKAIENYNNFFKEKDGDVYLGTLLPPFNFMFFGNENYKYLPITEKQELADSRGLTSQMYIKSGSVLNYYETLINSGKKIYVTNYFLDNNPGVWAAELKKLEDHFAFTQVSDGCMGICKIYKVELKKEISPSSSLTKGIRK